jgi:PKD repeat protein
MLNRYITVFSGLLIGLSALNGQAIDQLMADPTANFYTIQRKYQREMAEKKLEIQRERQARHGQTEKSGSIQENEAKESVYLHYQRWAAYMEPRVYPSGNLTLPSTNWQEFEAYLSANPQARAQWLQAQQIPNSTARSASSTQSSNWSFAGPTGGPIGSGAGRINFLRFNPGNSSILYAGAPAGGLWKSTNGGATWSTGTDFLTVIGCTDIAIDPTNTSVMYLASGDGDAGDTYSIGVLKSTDGGITWNATGLSWTVGQGRTISRLLMHPTNSQIILAATSEGIYRTTNGGTSWTQVQNNHSFRDIEFKPGTPNTVYATGTRFYKSTDNGVTWVQVTTGLPASNTVDRLSIAVTAANSAYIYVLAGNNNNGGFKGMYRSTDSGVTFSLQSSTPNIMGWSDVGNDVGGQSWYDQGLVVSPTSQNEVFVGGVNIWRSTDGGVTWALNADWTGGSASYVHADIHDLVFLPGSSTTLFAGCDGGVFKTINSGTNWGDISSNMSIAQIYRIGLSASNSSVWLTGHQDNGTNLKFGGSYVGVMFGDGMDCFIDRTTNQVMYGEQNDGALNRSTDGGSSWTSIVTGLSGNPAWVTPWYQDPVTANTIYVGYTNLFKSTNQGSNWSQLTALPGSPGGSIVDFSVAASNTQVIYVARPTGLFRSTNGGSSWTTITGTLPVNNASISRVVTDPSNSNTVWVSFSGYSTGNKVFRSTNGGSTWTNISTGLPNIPANCIVLVPGSTTGGAYVGMDVGVYYIDNTFTSWQPYFTGLANAPIFDLEIYNNTKKLRAATFGRGIWEVDLYNDGTFAPVAQFLNTTNVICPGGSISFTDQSTYIPTSWSWSFPGGTPSSSTSQNPPVVTWNTPGTYTVTLTATNANGSTTAGIVVGVLPSQSPPATEGFEGTTFLPANWVSKNVNNDIIYWDRANVGRNSSWSARFNNYNLNANGAQDEMWAPKTSFVGLQNCTLTFDVAHARYSNAYIDSLEVLISTNCGSTWTSVYLKGGSTLATVADNTNSFVPTNSQWRNESVNLNAYIGQANVLIAFRNRGHYGNNIYVDNVNITGQQTSLPAASFTPSATTACQGSGIGFTDNSSNSPTSWSWTFPSGSPATSTAQNPSNVTWNTPGTYTVSLTVTNANGSNTTTRVITINAKPTVTATAASASICSGNSVSLSASGANTYSWMPGSLSGASVSVSPTATTTYTVTGTATNTCTNTKTVTVTVNQAPTVSATSASASICSGNSVSLTASGANTYSWMPGSLSGASISVSPTATTTYTVTGTATNTCTNTKTVTVTVNQLPTINISAGSTSLCTGGTTTLTANGANTYNWMPGSLSGSSVSITPASTTTYTVTGTSAANCSATSTITITVGSLPTISVSGNTAICAGDTANLSATGASTYIWMPGNITTASATLNPSSTTTYTITGTVSSNCSNTATVTLTVDTPPATPSITNSGNVLSSTVSGSSYQWYLNGLPIAGATAQSYSATQSGSYTVEVFSAGNCSSGQSLATVITSLTDLPTWLVSFTVSPNPNNGQFLLTFEPVYTDDYLLEVYNALGQLVYAETLQQISNNYQKEFDLQAHATGIYTIRLRNAEHVYAARVVVH